MWLIVVLCYGKGWRLPMNELKKVISDELRISTVIPIPEEISIKDNTAQQEWLFDTIADNIISKLPKQIITEDRIVEALDKAYRNLDNDPEYDTDKIFAGSLDYTEDFDYFKKKVAHVILEGQEWEVVAKGKIKVERFANVQNTLANVLIGINYFTKLAEMIADDFEGKNIEIAVREVK